MLLTVSLALAGSLNVVDTCRWNKPGADRFTGNVVSAVDHYTDIPPAIRDRLKTRLADHRYDDVVTITKDAIRGEQAYEPGITGMHFGENRLCQEVTRKRWKPERQLKGLVYCEDGYCLMIPTVCGNLSRVQRARSDEPLDIEPAAGPPAEGGTPVAAGAAQPEPAPDDFAALPPTAAGVPSTVALVPAPPAWSPPPMPWWPTPVWTGPLFPPGVTRPPVVIPGVPEPSTWAQLVAGALVLGGWAWRRRSARA